MCELLGISSNKKTNLRYSMQAMEAHSRINGDGWGVAYYPDDSKQCAIYKEDCSLIHSDTARFLNSKNTIQSKIIINHIRQSMTSIAYDNTHPFSRELFGEQWVMIHNGANGLDNYFKEYLRSHDNKIEFIPFGTTGSDKAFCILLNELKNNVPIEVNCISSGNRLSVDCTYSFERAQRVIYEECIKIMNSRADFNMILSNGEYLIAFHSGSKYLHYVMRDGQSVLNSHIRLKDHDFELIGLEKEPDEKAAIVATEELTEGENWMRFDRGEFLVFKNGEVFFRNGVRVNNDTSALNPPDFSDIEVYDSSSLLDGKRADKRVIGMPLVLRQKLGVELGDRIIACNGGKEIELEVCSTDKRLLKGGSCEADNPDFHVCIPRPVREELGIMEVASMRNHLEGFRKKFTSVGLKKH